MVAWALSPTKSTRGRCTSHELCHATRVVVLRTRSCVGLRQAFGIAGLWPKTENRPLASIWAEGKIVHNRALHYPRMTGALSDARAIRK